MKKQSYIQHDIHMVSYSVLPTHNARSNAAQVPPIRVSTLSRPNQIYPTHSLHSSASP